MKAIDVANFFITVGLMNEGTEMTNARINKLLYFAQGWHLAKTGEPLFNDNIEAWDYGPVVHSVYSEFKRYGKNIITEPSENFDLNLMQDDDFATWELGSLFRTTPVYIFPERVNTIQFSPSAVDH